MGPQPGHVARAPGRLQRGMGGGLEFQRLRLRQVAGHGLVLRQGRRGAHHHIGRIDRHRTNRHMSLRGQSADAVFRVLQMIGFVMVELAEDRGNPRPSAAVGLRRQARGRPDRRSPGPDARPQQVRQHRPPRGIELAPELHGRNAQHVHPPYGLGDHVGGGGQHPLQPAAVPVLRPDPADHAEHPDLVRAGADPPQGRTDVGHADHHGIDAPRPGIRVGPDGSGHGARCRGRSEVRHTWRQRRHRCRDEREAEQKDPRHDATSTVPGGTTPPRRAPVPTQHTTSGPAAQTTKVKPFRDLS